jgi:hypothetical protein
MSRRVLVSTLSLLFGTAAHAGYYPGHIDPGGNGTDIPGFTGDVVFDIPNSCLTLEGAGWKHTDANTGFSVSSGCGSAFVYSATIDLYSVAVTEPAFPGTVLGQFSLAEIDTWPILGVLSVNGMLTGVDTDAMGPETGIAVGTHHDWEGDSFWLQFVSGACTAGCTPPGQFPSSDPAYISVFDIDNFSPPGTVIFGSACDTPDSCRVVPTVPEPGTLALLLGALGGGWLARRRKRDASA